MTGPEHYREAERLLAKSKASSADVANWEVAQAQAHATLALVAAQMEQASVTAGGSGFVSGWTKTLA